MATIRFDVPQSDPVISTEKHAPAPVVHVDKELRKAEESLWAVYEVLKANDDPVAEIVLKLHGQVYTLADKRQKGEI